MKLEIRDAAFSYVKERTIFSGLDLDLEDGRVMAVLGPNGSGKTTFLRCVMGMLYFTQGSCRLNGEETRTMPAREFWKLVSYVPQQRSAQEGEETPVDEIRGDKARGKGQSGKQHREKDRVLHKGHIREDPQDETEHRAPGRPLEHADRHRHRRQDHRADARDAKLGQQHILRQQRQKQVQRVLQHPPYPDLGEDLSGDQIP